MTGPYKIGTLARLTGFSPALLRMWERRFSLLTPGRGAGGQRVYDDDDLAVLRRVRTLIDQGRSIGEIAALGRDGLMADAHGPDVGIPNGRVPASGPTAGTAAARRRIVEAALALDARAVSTALDDAFAVMAPDHAVADVIEPAAIEIGNLWARGTCSIASEHLASAQFLDRLGRLLGAAQPPDPHAPRVVAACFPGEQHQLGLMILSWHVARRGARVVYLGAALPAEDLAHACRSLSPAAVLLSATRPAVFREHWPRITRALSGTRVGRVFAGGQGVPADARSSSPRVQITRRQPLADTVSDVLAGLPHQARSRSLHARAGAHR